MCTRVSPKSPSKYILGPVPLAARSSQLLLPKLLSVTALVTNWWSALPLFAQDKRLSCLTGPATNHNPAPRFYAAMLLTSSCS